MNLKTIKHLIVGAATFLAAVAGAHATPTYLYRLPVPGLAASAAQTVPLTDPYFAYVTALLTMDGANGATAVSDVKGGSFTLTTGAQITTSTSEFGGASLSLISGYLTGPSTDCAFGTGDFTVEMFVKGSTSQAYQIFDARPKNTNGAYLTLGWSPGFLVYTNGGNLITSSSTFPFDSSWHYFAYSRNSAVGRLFVDGTLVATGADATNYTCSGFGIGWNAFGVTTNGMYVDEVRITKGVGRYTSNFPVPPTAFPTQ
jgi:hypothetical protein